MKTKKTYLIGEIGQNHNGSVDIAKLIIDYIAKPVEDNLFKTTLKKMDAVKLTKRDLKHELSSTQMSQVYDNINSFGRTYGEHRQHLELNDEQHYEIYKYAKNKDLEFVETLCAIDCLSILKYFEPDKLKVASRDLTNLPLIQALAETKIPIILSTGMSGKIELNNAIEIITKYHSDISILHCVSQYPTEYKNVNLNTIKYLIKEFPKFKIGYSDHTIGIATPIAAVTMGAEIIEKHITIDRRMKGTDHAGSLGIDGIIKMVRDIRNLEESFGVEDIFISDSVNSSKIKLERSIASKKAMKIGHKISIDDIHLLSPGDGIKWIDKNLIINKRLKKDIGKNEIIYPDYL